MSVKQVMKLSEIVCDLFPIWMPDFSIWYSDHISRPLWHTNSLLFRSYPRTGQIWIPDKFAGDSDPISWSKFTPDTSGTVKPTRAYKGMFINYVVTIVPLLFPTLYGKRGIFTRSSCSWVLCPPSFICYHVCLPRFVCS